jgi:hypothetical protein
MTTGEIPGFESERLRTKNRLPENLVTPEIIVIEYAALSIIGNPLEYWRL